METYNFSMVHGCVAKRRNPVPLLFLHTAEISSASNIFDLLMKAGAHVLDPGTLLRLPKANPLVRVWISPDTVTVEIDRQDDTGRCMQLVWKFDSSEKEEWRQRCYDMGGVVVVVTSGADPDYHEKLLAEDLHIGDVMAISATTYFPRQ